ncbi:hypothetical protein PC116_g7265 [Phytophthora cactorum]|nr:hypothetical protein PC123_g7652 [Phytophthora cactorum]KAG4244926.1 hypothetical protein PC116_g7265 [Phytophthora cactorum]
MERDTMENTDASVENDGVENNNCMEMEVESDPAGAVRETLERDCGEWRSRKVAGVVKMPPRDSSRGPG